MMLRLSSLLPGISAGARLGLSEWEREPSAIARDDRTAAGDTVNRSERNRLPPREDAFYWSLMHSHL